MSARNQTESYSLELWRNQVWQSLNFLAKAGFFVLFTPWMLSLWGAEGYGLFALASSMFVSMAFLDGGVRALTRLRLVEAKSHSDDAEYRKIYGEGLTVFSCICLLATLGVTFAAATGILTACLNLRPESQGVLVLAVVVTSIFMVTTLALEPLAADGKLSVLKTVNTIGAVGAIIVIAFALFFKAGPGLVVALYAISLSIPNVVMIFRGRLLRLQPWRHMGNPATLWRTLRSGFWYWLTTVALTIKSHGLTFLVSALAGPTEAGLYYILLRLTEIIGTVGATASETSLVSLSSCQSAEERRVNLRQCWLYTVLFCTHGAMVLIFLGEPLLGKWLSDENQIPRGIGIAVACFGLAGAFSRTIVNVATGLHLVKLAAIANILEAGFAVAASVIGYHIGGLVGLFLGGSFGIVFLLKLTSITAQKCDTTAAAIYLGSVTSLLPLLLVSGLAELAASFSNSPIAWGAAIVIAGLLGSIDLRRITRKSHS